MAGTVKKSTVLDVGSPRPDAFWINDVELTIPAEQISISDRSFSHDWQTLRTSGTRRSKSGHALTAISFGVAFNGNDSINNRLRPLVAGLRSTPFCVVNNEYLNKQLAKLHGPRGEGETSAYELFKPTTLALTSMTFSTVPGRPGMLYGQFEFLYFNHLPYCNLWAYKSGDDFATPGSIDDSSLWKQFYAPYLNRTESISWPHRNPQLSPFVFRWREFTIRQTGSEDSIKAAKALVSAIKNRPEESISALKNVLGKHTVDANNSLSMTFDKLVDAGVISQRESDLAKKLGKETIEKTSGDVVYPLLKKLYHLVDSGQKNATNAVNENKNAVNSAISVLDARIKLMEQKRTNDLNPATWEEIEELAADFILSHKSGAKVRAGGYRVYGRRKFFRIQQTNEGKEADSIVEGLSITITPSLAIIPMTGHTHPTCQFSGGYDIELSVTMNMMNIALNNFRQVYHTWEDINLKFRQVPQGFRNVVIDSDFARLFGITEFQPASLESTTIPEQPGRSRAVLSLADAGITSQSQQIEDPETFQQEYVASSPALRQEIYKVLEKYFVVDSRDPQYVKLNVDNDPRNSVFNTLVIETASLYNAFSYVVMDKIFWGSGNSIDGSEGRTYYYEVMGWSQSESLYGPVYGLERLQRAVRNRKNKGPDSALGRVTTEGWSIKNAIKKRNLHTYLKTPSEVVQSPGSKKLLGLHMGLQGLGKLVPGGDSLINIAAAGGAALGPSGSTTDNPYWNPGDPLGTGKEPGVATSRSLEEAAVEKYLLGIELRNYQQRVNTILDLIVERYVDLPQFAHIKVMKEKSGVGKGRSAYPDFVKSLRSIASFLDTENSDTSLLNYDPDFYMWYPSFDNSSSLYGAIIDSSVISRAREQSIKLFKASQGDIENFFQSRYKSMLKDSVVDEPYKMLEKFTSKGMAPALYNNVSYQNSTLNEGEGGEKGRGIKITIAPDPKMTPVNFYSSKNPEVIANDAITHSTDLQELWGGTEILSGDAIKKKTSGSSQSIQPETGSVSMSSRPNSNLGVKSMVIDWPKPPSSQSPTGGLVSPIVRYKSSQKKDRGCLSVRDIGAGGIKGEQSFSYRRKGTISDWRCAASILKRAGCYDPFKAPSLVTEASYYNKTVAKWTVSEYFDWKKKTGKKMGYIHKGIDIGAPIGTEVYAIADGIVRYLPRKAMVGAGLYIEIEHPSKPNGIGMSRYLHLQAVSPLLKRGGQVSAGDCIGVIGVSGYKNMTWAHLHFEVWDRYHQIWQRTSGKPKLLNPLEVDIPWTSKGVSKEKISAKDKKALSTIATETPKKDVTSTLTSPLIESIKDFEARLIKGSGQRLVRAYPTFKLYFIEDDSRSRRRLAFDDFFSYDAVSSIRVVRSRKIPADLCVIELTNIGGVLSNRKYRHDFSVKKGKAITGRDARDLQGNVVDENNALDNPSKVNTLAENPIASIMLQEGMNIHLKLGYSNDPSLLEPVFTGKIEAVMFSETEEFVTIVAQSYATELTQDIKGIEKPKKLSSASVFGWTAWGLADHASTGRIFEEMLAQPEVLHFGRWERGEETANRDLLTNKYQFVAQPSDDNIFAPPPSADLDILGSGLIVKDLHYLIYRTTIWDIFKEMELRHPNYVGSPVPYSDKYGERMTYFFGLPNQLYFARHPKPNEQKAQDALKTTEEDLSKILSKQVLQLDSAKKVLRQAFAAPMKIASKIPAVGPAANFLLGPAMRLNERVADKVFETIYNNHPATVAIKSKIRETVHKIYKRKRLQLAKEAGYIRPFRRYHLLTSNNHIIANNIRADARDVANTIVVKYQKTSKKDLKKADLWGGISAAADADKEETFVLKLDNALPTDEIRVQIAEPINVTNDEIAKRYALGLLCQNVKDIYKGDIQILGDASIRPYDICFCLDEVSDFVGPIEVEQVVHVFTRDGGFRTEITPDMVVVAAEWSLLSTLEAMSIIVEGGLKNLYGKDAMSLIKGSLSPMTSSIGMGAMMVGSIAAKKIIHFTQLGQPVIMSPIVHHGREFTGGIPTRKIPTSVWNTLFGEWNFEADRSYHQWYEDAAEGIYKTVKKYTGGYSTGDILKGFSANTVETD